MDRADAEIVDEGRIDGGELGGIGDAEAQDGTWAEPVARLDSGGVCLADMDTIRARLERHVEPVVDDQGHAVRQEQCLEATRQ